MPLKQRYVTGTNKISSYNFQDIITGQGIGEFYGLMLEDSTGNVYRISADSGLFSKEWQTTQLRNVNTTYTFDLPFYTPQIVDGEIIVSVTYFAYSVYSGSESFTNTVTISVYHYDGSTETQIDSSIAETVTDQSPDSNVTYDQLTAGFTASNKHFKIGDKLRVKINLVTGNSSNANSYGGFYHDPAGRVSVTNYGSQLKINVPFKILE